MGVTPPSADSDERTDIELMVAYCKGEMGALKILYERHHRRLVIGLYASVGDWGLAEELAQETWLVVLAQWNTFDPAKCESFAAWIKMIGYHKAVSYWRRQHPMERLDQDGEPQDEPADKKHDPLEDWIEQDDIQQHLREALDQLKPHHRQVVVLRFFESYDIEVIAQLLDLPKTAVYRLLHQAYERLRELLKDWRT